MKRITISALGAIALVLSGCNWALGIRGNGNITTDQRTVADFSEIQAGGAFSIEWHSGPPSLKITTDQNLFQHIDSSISDHRLRLRTREHVRPTHRIKVAISSPVRDGAKISGVVNLSVPQLSGAKFYFQATGASDVTLDGNVGELMADMTGASDLRAKHLQARTAEISTTGAADAEISVSELLRVSITGAGTVNYHGHPPKIEKHITGAGSIRHKD